MPNFNTHWLVAIKCLDSGALPYSIKNGYKKYKKITKKLKIDLSLLINEVVDEKTRKQFVNTKLNRCLKDYNEKLTNKENHDDITCFSAYALGACGPDFWTVTSTSRGGVIPDTAGLHFDLGHYNRSHKQFQIAIQNWASMDKNSLQVKAEQSYFYGMATHIATDCIVHQLVNVYAGAYHLIGKNWENQHGSLPKNLWSVHNKVEHFWDSYIRYKYFGDIGKIFKNDNKNQLMTPLGFPTVEKYCELLEKELKELNETKNSPTTSEDLNKRLLSIEAKTALIEDLKDNKTKIEKAFILPRIFCDRVIKDKETALKPFLYDIIVDKKKGAYKSDIIFKRAIKESTSYQFKVKETFNENKKLSYFASESNKKVPNVSFNYLNYIVCPNLEYTQKLG